MRISPAALCVVLLTGSAAKAQEPASDPALRSVRAALLNPGSLVFTIPPATPDLNPPPMKLGPLTVVTPQTPGEVGRISVPVGELVMRAVNATSRAWKQHQERVIRERVEREVQAIEARIAADSARQ